MSFINFMILGSQPTDRISAIPQIKFTHDSLVRFASIMSQLLAQKFAAERSAAAHLTPTRV